MTSAQIMELLVFLDDLFKLGGQLLQSAIQKSPELLNSPLPELSLLEKTRMSVILNIES